MRLIQESKLHINQPGTIKIIPEEQDDLWILSNIIHLDDVVCAETTRKVHSLSGPGPGPGGKNPVRVKFNMEVKIKGVDYDNKSSSIRPSGKVITTNSYVNSGAHHALELEKNKAFELRKQCWDASSIENLKEGCKNNSGCDLVVLLIKPGLAHLYMVGKSVTNLSATIDGQIQKGCKKNDPTKFFGKILDSLTKTVDFSVLKCLVIAGAGSTKAEFKQFLLSSKVKSIDGARSRVALIDLNSMGKEGLREVLGDPGAMNLIKDTKSATELKAMKEFNDMLLFHPDKACYGAKSVDLANELVAIETLLITDDLYRNRDIELRKKYIELMDSVKKSGGKALVISSMHVSGEQLAQLTGVAAVLRFPVPNIDDLEM